jgi:hypothetical protein
MNNTVTASGAAAGLVGGLVVLGILLGMYLLPTIIAAARGHRQTGAIAGLNILLGWTVLGWIGSFVWSLTTPAPPQTIIIQQAAPAATQPPPA